MWGMTIRVRSASKEGETLLALRTGDNRLALDLCGYNWSDKPLSGVASLKPRKGENEQTQLWRPRGRGRRHPVACMGAAGRAHGVGIVRWFAAPRSADAA